MHDFQNGNLISTEYSLGIDSILNVLNHQQSIATTDNRFIWTTIRNGEHNDGEKMVSATEIHS